MVDVAEEARVAHGPEAGGQQCALRPLGVRDEDVDVAERPEPRLGVELGKHRTLHQNDRAVVCLTHAPQEQGRAQGHGSRELLVVNELPVDRAALKAKASRGQQLQAVPPEVVDGRRPLDELVDRAPELGRRSDPRCQLRDGVQ